MFKLPFLQFFKRGEGLFFDQKFRNLMGFEFIRNISASKFCPERLKKYLYTYFLLFLYRNTSRRISNSSLKISKAIWAQNVCPTCFYCRENVLWVYVLFLHVFIIKVYILFCMAAHHVALVNHCFKCLIKSGVSPDHIHFMHGSEKNKNPWFMNYDTRYCHYDLECMRKHKSSFRNCVNAPSI